MLLLPWERTAGEELNHHGHDPVRQSRDQELSRRARRSRLLPSQDVSLDVVEGEFLCLLGASGCGKSTMLSLFAGFLQPTAGQVMLRGQPITGIEPRCGMVFQSYALFPVEDRARQCRVRPEDAGRWPRGATRDERNDSSTW